MIATRNTISGKVDTKVYDAVMVCTGHHADTNIPSFPGMDSFKGQIIHSRDYKEPRDLEGRRAVVLGIGNSGVDTAVELSRVCSKVTYTCMLYINHK